MGPGRPRGPARWTAEDAAKRAAPAGLAADRSGPGAAWLAEGLSFFPTAAAWWHQGSWLEPAAPADIDREDAAGETARTLMERLEVTIWRLPAPANRAPAEPSDPFERLAWVFRRCAPEALAAAYLAAQAPKAPEPPEEFPGARLLPEPKPLTAAGRRDFATLMERGGWPSGADASEALRRPPRKNQTPGWPQHCHPLLLRLLTLRRAWPMTLRASPWPPPPKPFPKPFPGLAAQVLEGALALAYREAEPVDADALARRFAAATRTAPANAA